MAVPKRRKSYHRTRLKNNSKRFKLQVQVIDWSNNQGVDSANQHTVTNRSIHTCKKCNALVRPHMLFDHVSPCR